MHGGQLEIQTVKTNAVLRMRPKRAAPKVSASAAVAATADHTTPRLQKRGSSGGRPSGVPREIALPASHPRVENDAPGTRVVAKVVGRARGRHFTSLGALSRAGIVTT